MATARTDVSRGGDPLQVAVGADYYQFPIIRWNSASRVNSVTDDGFPEPNLASFRLIYGRKKTR